MKHLLEMPRPRWRAVRTPGRWRLRFGAAGHTRAVASKVRALALETTECSPAGCRATHPAVAAGDATVTGQAIDPQMAAQMLPPALLHGDEIVLLLIKPSLWYIALTSGRFISIVALVGVLAARVLPYGYYVNARSIALATVVLAAARLVWAVMEWTSHIYMLTNYRVVTIRGVLNLHIYQAPLRKIQRTAIDRTFVMRLLGIGSIGFATAATYTFDSVWMMIARPLEVHAEITNMLHKHRM